MFSKKKISREEYNDWLIAFESANYQQEKRKEFEQKYGDNRVGDFGVDFNELKYQHYSFFKNGGSFPAKYKGFLNAHHEEGYEIARYGSVFNCRKEMIEDAKLTNDHYKVAKDENGFRPLRQISKQGIDILAMCEAYDEYLEAVRKDEDKSIFNHRLSYEIAKNKIYDTEPAEIYCNHADTKKAAKQLAVVGFEQNTTDPNDRDFLDDFGNGLKRFFGFKTK